VPYRPAGRTGATTLRRGARLASRRQPRGATITTALRARRLNMTRTESCPRICVPKYRVTPSQINLIYVRSSSPFSPENRIRITRMIRRYTCPKGGAISDCTYNAGCGTTFWRRPSGLRWPDEVCLTPTRWRPPLEASPAPLSVCTCGASSAGMDPVSGPTRAARRRSLSSQPDGQW
jgi:hypothetical protein